MNLTDILFIAKSHGIKPDASLSDILLAKKLDEGIIRTIKGNPLRFSARKAQKAKNPNLTLLPIQDLHGYSKPWVGGMSDQLLDESTAEAGTIDQETGEDKPSSGVTRTDFMPTKGATSLFLTADNSMRFFWYDSSKTYLSNDACAKKDYVEVPNNAAYFRVIGINSIFTKPIMINSGTTMKPYCPYTNICPISGSDSAEIIHDNENVLKWRSDIGLPKTTSGITYSDAGNGKIQLSGTASALSPLALTDQTYSKRDFKPNTTYYFKLFNAPAGVSLQLYVDDVSVTYASEFSYTMPPSFDTARVRIRIANGTAITTPVTVAPMMSIGQAPSEYVENNRQTITFTFGQTVYGGTINFDTGVMSIDTLRVDLGSLSWSASSAPIVFFADPRTLGEFIGVGKTFIACDSYQCQDNAGGVATVRNYPDGSICGFTLSDASYHRVYVKDTRFTTKEEFSEAVNGVYACYKLATPTTIQLTPQEINLLKGINNIWTDGDTIELTYKA